MLTLLVQQTTLNGSKKSWKLTPGKGLYTFGASRLSDLISIDTQVQTYEGVFEFRNNQWNYIDFNKENFLQNKTPTILLDKELKLKFKNSQISVTPILKDVEIYANLEKSKANPSANTKQHHLYLVRHFGKVVETRTLKPNVKFRPQSTTEKIVVEPVPSQEWVRKKYGEYEISQRLIYVEDVSPFAKFKLSQITDRDSLKNMSIVGACCLLFAVISLVVPKPPQEQIVSVPQSATKLIVRTDFKKTKEQKPKTQSEKSVAQKAAAPAVNPSTAPAGGKVAGMLKSLNSGRLSNLLSKISAQAQKSKNAIISKGVVAGTGPSGRALASIGPIDKSGKDWSSDAKGTGVTISTSGLGGGKSINGVGQLAGGKIGQAGVGLIEDESEVVGGLDRDVIASYIKTQLGQILYCYERQLSAKKDLFGKVAVRFTIGPTGQVETQNIGDTTLKNATVEGCILNKVAQWKFPAPQGGTKVNVTYPFLFKSTN